MKKWIAAGLLVAIGLTTGGCASAPGGTTAPTDVVETASPDEAEALRFRETFGLRSDVAHVRSVAVDPAASSVDFAVPLLPAEIAELNARVANSEAIRDVIRRYADAHLDEFAGLYIDQDNGGAVTTLWTAHLDQHAAAIRALVRPGSRIAFRAAAFTTEELEELQERVSADWDWMREVGIAPSGVEVDVIRNRVAIYVSSADPDAPEIVRSHYGADGAMIIVTSDGTGAALIPIATIRGVVVMADGGAPGDNTFEVVTRGPGPGRCGGDVDEMGHGVGPDGAFEIRCAAGSWTVAIQDAPIGGPNGIDLGHLDVFVPEGGVLNIVITLEP